MGNLRDLATFKPKLAKVITFKEKMKAKIVTLDMKSKKLLLQIYLKAKISKTNFFKQKIQGNHSI